MQPGGGETEDDIAWRNVGLREDLFALHGADGEASKVVVVCQGVSNGSGGKPSQEFREPCNEPP